MTKSAALKAAISNTLSEVSQWFAPEGPPPDSLRERFQAPQLSALLPYRTWDESKGLYQTNSTMGFVLEVVPLIGASDITNKMLGELFTQSVPQGAYVQIISVASPKIGDVVDEWAATRAKQGAMFKTLAAYRREHFRRGAWNSASAKDPFYFRDYRVFVAVELPESSTVIADQLVDAREKFRADLEAMQQVESFTVRPRELIRLIGELLNPTTNIRPREDEFAPDIWLNQQMVDSETRWSLFRDRIEIRTRAISDDYIEPGTPSEEVALKRELGAKEGKFQLRGFSVKRFPEHFTQGHMSRLLGDMFNNALRVIGPTVMTVGFQALSPEKTKADTEFKRLRTQQAVNNPINRMFPDTRATAEDWTMVMEQVSDGALLAHVYMSVLSIAPSAIAEKAERHLRAVFRNTRFELSRADDVHLPTVLSCLPLTLGRGMFQDLITRGKTRRMPTTALAKIAPMQGEFMGMGVPHLLLVGRRGQVLCWSNFANKAGNHNTCVVGQSGSGKSVLMQEMMASYRGAGADVFIIDDGKSFMNSCKLLGGAFIEFDLDQKPCLNPFGLIDAGSAEDGPRGEYEAEGLSMVRMMMGQAARGAEGLTSDEKGVLEKAIQIVWDSQRGNASFAAVIQELRQGHGEIGVSLARSLSAYDEGGIYGGVFNGPMNLDIKNPLTVFEMGALETKPDLRSVVVLALLFLVRRAMRRGGRNQKKVLIIDEAWNLLSDGQAGEFIEGFARRCRKEGGALITGTQSLTDYYKTTGAKACYENSDHIIVLRLKEEVLDQLRSDERLKVDEGTMALLASLTVRDREYSEMVLMGPDAKFLARLVLDPYSATLYSTTPKVFEEIQELQRRGVGLEEAVAAVANLKRAA